MYIYIYIYLSLSIYIYIYIYIYVYTRAPCATHGRTRTRTYAGTHTRMHACTHEHMKHIPKHAQSYLHTTYTLACTRAHYSAHGTRHNKTKTNTSSVALRV